MFSQIQSRNESDYASHTRVNNTTPSSFNVKIEEQNDTTHTHETVGYIVIEPATLRSGAAKVEETKYYPYGVIQEGGSEKYLYTGKELDRGTGLYYYEARYYNPNVGRFIQPDTLIPDIYNPQSLNRYSYVLNNPLRYVDPNGRDAVGTDVGLVFSFWRWTFGFGKNSLYNMETGEFDKYYYAMTGPQKGLNGRKGFGVTGHISLMEIEGLDKNSDFLGPSIQVGAEAAKGIGGNVNYIQGVEPNSWKGTEGGLSWGLGASAGMNYVHTYTPEQIKKGITDRFTYLVGKLSGSVGNDNSLPPPPPEQGTKEAPVINHDNSPNLIWEVRAGNTVWNQISGSFNQNAGVGPGQGDDLPSWTHGKASGQGWHYDPTRCGPGLGTGFVYD